MFLEYSQKSCIFECRLKHAVKEVGCLPWDYPVPIENENPMEVPVCLSSYELEGNALEKFRVAMSSPENELKCDCMAG